MVGEILQPGRDAEVGVLAALRDGRTAVSPSLWETSWGPTSPGVLAVLVTRKLAGFSLQTMVLSKGMVGAGTRVGDHGAGWGLLVPRLLRAVGLCQLFREVFGKQITCAGINAVCKALGRWEEL